MFSAQINGYLARALVRSPRALELCMELEGRRIELIIEGFPEPLSLSAASGALRLTGGAAAPESAPADVRVNASPLALLALAGGDAEGALAWSGASFSGDQQLIRQFQELARLLRPDPEAAAGQVMGRIPAHLAARAMAAFGAWGRAARDSVVRTTADYLAHESRDLVPRAEAEGFLGGVEALRAQLASAEARAARLAARLDQLTPPAATAGVHSTPKSTL